MNLKNYIFITICLFFLGCFNGGISGTGGPALPPSESMGVIDIPDQQFDQKRYKGLKLTSHYDHANAIYQIMHERIFAEMAIQSKLFNTIYQTEPEKDLDNIYHWQTSDTGVDQIKSVDFQGKKNISKVTWLMNILDLSSIEDSLLEGTSNLENTNGSWTVLKTKTEKVLQIDWEVNNDIVTVIYTNISDSEHDGDTITLVIQGSDIQMVYKDNSDLKTVELKWNVETSAGSVLDPDFIDGQERFWNSALENINDSDNF